MVKQRTPLQNVQGDLDGPSFQATFRHFPDPVLIQSRRGRLLDANSAATYFFNVPRNKLLGTDLGMLLTAPNPEHREHIDQMLKGKRMHVEHVMLLRNGHAQPVEVQASGVAYAGESALLVHLHDISRHKATELGLRRQADLSDTILKKSAFGFLLADAEGWIIDANETAGKILGYSDAGFRELRMADLRDGDGGRGKSDAMGGPFAKEAVRYETRWKHRKGRWVDLEVTTDLIQQGSESYLFSFFRDITARKRSQKIQVALYDIAHQAMTAEDLPGFLERIHRSLGPGVAGNNFIVSLYDADRKLFTHPYFADEKRGPEEQRAGAKGLTDFVISRKKPFRLSSKGGAARLKRAGFGALPPVPTDWLGVPLMQGSQAIGVLSIHDYSGKVEYTAEDEELLAYVASQISTLVQRKQAEMVLRDSEERYRRHFEEDPTGDFIARPDGKIIACNPAFIEIFRFDSERSALNHKIGSLFTSRKNWLEFVELLRAAHELGEYETTMKRKDKSIAHVTAKMVATFGADGGMTEIKGYISDITERKELEALLRQSQKMEAIGRLAGGIAHDFNNLLTPVIGYGRLILDEANLPEPYRSDVEQIVRAGERATDLTKKLLAFGRKQVIQMLPVSMDRVVTGLEPLLRRSLGPNIELTINLESGPGSVLVDAGQLEQVLLNLVLNARDALPKGGRVVIQVRGVNVGNKEKRSHPDIEPGDYIRIRVRDNGVGMTEAVREHAFEPFFTTKEKDRGSGLGLSTAYGIVQQFQGFIELKSRHNAGTTIDIYLPRSDEPAHDLPPEQEERVPKGRETILLIEDEDPVREAAVRMLDSLGYQILTARNGGEALLAVEQYKKPIHLLVTDIIMPRMNGQQVVRRLRKIRKDFKVLYTSGYAADTVADVDLETIRSRFIQKPFTRKTLGLAVRQILDDD